MWQSVPTPLMNHTLTTAALVLSMALLGCSNPPVRDRDRPAVSGPGSGSSAEHHAESGAGQNTAGDSNHGAWTEASLRPGPGLDLTGPIPLASGLAEPRANTQSVPEPLPLGHDRAFVPVEIPTPPRGGAVGFSFDQGKRGWVARVPESRQLPTAAYGDGKVYISGGFDSVNFYALEAETGRFTWAATNLEDNGPTAAVYEDGWVIFNTESCTLFVLDAATGKKRWSKWLGDPTLAQTAVHDGLIYAAHPSPDGPRLSAYKVTNGARVWSRRVTGELLAAPVVHGDSVYATTIHGTAYRFEHRRGKRIWAARLGATTAPWIAGESLFVTRRDGADEALVVLDTATGESVRTHYKIAGTHLSDVPRNLDSWRKVWAFEGSRPVVTGGVSYAAMGGDIVAMDADQGTPRWIRRHQQADGKRAVGSVAVAGPQVVAATRDGRVIGLDVDTGYTLWAYDLAEPIVAEPIVARGWVYVTTRRGRVIGLEVGDTTLDGWHMFGGSPGHNGPTATEPPASHRNPV